MHISLAKMNAQMVSAEKTFFSPLAVFGSPGGSSDSKLEDENSVLDVEGKVKTRLLSMWNNVKFGMKLKTNFSKESPVWLLGKCYHRRLENPEVTEFGTDVAAFTQSQNNIIGKDDEEGLEAFKVDFISKIWLTYRREFPTLNGSTYSSDCGWGCMLRSGQMLLAQALVCHFLGRNWKWDPDQPPITSQAFIEVVNHRKILKWFGDKPSINSPLSLHVLVNLGESSGKKAGDWYGPGFVAHLLKQAVNLASKDNIEFDSLTVYVAQDCADTIHSKYCSHTSHPHCSYGRTCDLIPRVIAVYIKDIVDECTDGNNDQWKSLVLLIPIRLGAEKFNQIYAPCLTAMLSLEQCLGIIGGRPKHSLYFVGYQDDKLIHLDPHYCQEMVDVWAENFSMYSFHCRSPRKMLISKMDPSCCIGFYCATKECFFNLMKIVEPLAAPPNRSNGACEYPMFVFCDGYSRDSQLSLDRITLPEVQYSTDGQENDMIDTEEFEIL